MKFKVMDLEKEITSLEKFVVTCFLDVPSRGLVTVYVEVCSSQAGSFELITPVDVKIEQDEQLYSNVHVCERLFKSYTPLRGGEHLQMVGEKKLHVIPKRCAIRKVAPPRTDRGACCHSIAFDSVPELQRAWGTWLFWVQPGRYTGFRDHLLRARFEFQVGNLRIENFYFYINQPPGYRVDASLCEVSSMRDSITDSPHHNPMYEFEVADDFLVFPAWQPFFYNRKILKNRRSFDLKGGQRVTLSFSLMSEIATRKLALRSYFMGIAIALSLSLLSEVIAAMFMKSHEIWFLIGSLLMTVALGYLGWRMVK